MTESNARAVCESCGGTTKSDVVSLSLWTDHGLVVIEDVPAEVCDACGEQFYDDATQSRLRILASGGFARKDAVREIAVPVYSLAGVASPAVPVEDVA